LRSGDLAGLHIAPYRSD